MGNFRGWSERSQENFTVAASLINECLLLVNYIFVIKYFMSE